VVNLEEVVWTGEKHDGSLYSIDLFTPNCVNVENGVQYGLARDKRLAGSGRQSIFG